MKHNRPHPVLVAASILVLAYVIISAPFAWHDLKRAAGVVAKAWGCEER